MVSLALYLKGHLRTRKPEYEARGGAGSGLSGAVCSGPRISSSILFLLFLVWYFGLKSPRDKSDKLSSRLLSRDWTEVGGAGSGLSGAVCSGPWISSSIFLLFVWYFESKSAREGKPNKLSSRLLSRNWMEVGKWAPEWDERVREGVIEPEGGVGLVTMTDGISLSSPGMVAKNEGRYVRCHSLVIPIIVDICMRRLSRGCVPRLSTTQSYEGLSLFGTSPIRQEQKQMQLLAVPLRDYCQLECASFHGDSYCCFHKSWRSCLFRPKSKI